MAWDFQPLLPAAEQTQGPAPAAETGFKSITLMGVGGIGVPATGVAATVSILPAGLGAMGSGLTRAIMPAGLGNMG